MQKVRIFFSTNEALSISCVFAFFIFLFFFEAITQGKSIFPAKVLSATDNIYSSSPSFEKIKENNLLSDLTFQMYPWSKLSEDGVKSGIIPLWNPYSLAGLPFLANDQSSVFEISKLFSRLIKLPTEKLLLFTSFVSMFLAGIFTYFFCRSLKISTFGSTVSSIAFSFSGPFIVWLGYPLTTTVLWLPFLLLASKKIICEEKIIWIILFSAGIIFQFFGGNPEISLFILFTVFLFISFELIAGYLKHKFTFRMVCKKIGILFIAFSIGIIISFPQVGSSFDFIMQSTVSKIGRGGVARESQQWPWENFILLVFPDFYGNPTLSNYWGRGNYNESAVYFGVLPFASAIFGVLFYAKKNKFLFWTILSLLSLLISFRFPIFNLLSYAPIFKLTEINRMRFIFVFVGSVLSGFGAETLFRNINKINVNRFYYIIFFIILFIFFSVYTQTNPISNFFIEEIWLKELVIILTILVFIFTLFYFLNKKLINLFHAKIIFIFLVFGELFIYGYKYHPPISEKLIFPKTKAIEFLQKNLGNFRVTSYKKNLYSKTSLIPNSSVYFKIQDIRGYEIAKPKRFEIFEEIHAVKNNNSRYRKFNQKMFNLLGVKYFIQGKNDVENAELNSNPYLSIVFQDKDVFIYQNNNVMPRAFIIHNIITAKNAEKAKGIFLKNNFDIRQDAVIETTVLSLNSSNSPPDKTSFAKIVDYSENNLTIETNLKKIGLLVLTDSFYPGWQAFIDGKKAKIYPTDIAFRGVFIPKGKHQISFKYWPNFPFPLE